MKYLEARFTDAGHTHVWARTDTGLDVSGPVSGDIGVDVVASGIPIDDFPATGPTYIEQRRPEYREKLATLKGEPGMDEVGVIGFQLDAIYAQLVTLAGGVGNMTPEMQGIIAEVQAVKAKFPKP
jgi:hypothetical protein